MRVVITGGAGFLGQRLVRALLERGTLAAADGAERRIDRITLLDILAPPPLDDPRVGVVEGDIADPVVVRRALSGGAASIFHLAAVVSGQAEADFDLGLRVNVDATRTLLEVCRADALPAPRLVFTSSIAVYGGELPDTVLDTTAVMPQSSYGAQKAIAELLIADFTRRGLVDGRIVRLPTVAVRPGRPNAAASSFASGIIREPLGGLEAVCPADPQTRLWLSSPWNAVASLLVAHDLSAETLGARRVVNAPGISITPAEMVQALEKAAGARTAARVRWDRDPRIAAIVGSWPGALDTTRARALGFPCDESFEAVIRRYVDEELGGEAPEA